MPSNLTTIPAPRVPLVDATTGLIATEWYRFLFNLYTLSGSGSNTITLDELQLGPPVQPTTTTGGGGSMVYPGAGIANSTGSAWGTSYSTTGSGTVVALQTGPTLSAPIIDGANPYIQFNNGSAVTVAAGKLWYDGSTGSWNAGMGNGNITQQIGEELFVYGKASAAITDSPLQIVYQTGVVGASGVIQFAPTTTGITNGDLILGVATENLALNAFGRITAWGVVHGITTNGTAFGETWADGDTIWYNPVTGNPTNVKPVAPNIKVSVGTLIKAGPGGSGSIQVEINHGSVLGGTDANVQLTSIANGNILTYDGTNAYWRNTDLTAGTGISVSKSATGVLTVTNTSPSSGGTVTSVSGTGTVNGITLTGTVTSSGSLTLGGTLGGIANSQLTNSSVTFNGVSVALGATGTITATATNALTIGTGLSGTSYNGSTAVTIANTGVLSVTGTAPVVSSGGQNPAISMAAASTSTNGYLTSTDWNTFNNKQPAGAYLTAVTASSPLSGSGTSGSPLIIAQATTSTSGYLSSTDWNTFNNKQPAGTYVTSVTGTAPVVSSGGTTPAISMAAATGSVNGYLTSTDWTTFNSKQAALVSGSNIKTVNGTSLLGSGDVGTIGIAYGGTGQTTASAAFNALSPITTAGDLILGNGVNSATRLAIGTSSYVLTSNGTTASWQAPATSNITTLGLWENNKTISANYTIGTGNSALSAGPITINSGVTVTVPSGSRWVIM